MGVIKAHGDLRRTCMPGGHSLRKVMKGDLKVYRQINPLQAVGMRAKYLRQHLGQKGDVEFTG